MNCVGVLKPAVYVNATFTKPQVLVFDLEGNILKYNDPIEAVKLTVGEKIQNAVYNLHGHSAAVEKFINEAGEDKIPTLIVFSQKTTAPGWLKNVALLMNDVVRVGMVSNPRDDLLNVFGMSEMPGIVIVYQTWTEDIQGVDTVSGQKSLGQTIYDKHQFGKPNFVNVVNFMLNFGRASHFEGFMDTLTSRMKLGVADSEEEGDDNSSSGAPVASEFAVEEFNNFLSKPPNRLGVYLFVDGYDTSST